MIGTKSLMIISNIATERQTKDIILLR